MDGRTDNMRENNYPYRPGLWVGRVDQKSLEILKLTRIDLLNYIMERLVEILLIDQ